MEEYAKIGEQHNIRPAVFELVIYDHVPFIDPTKYGLKLRGIDPAQYFVTSGDAVEKTKVLEKDMIELVECLRKARSEFEELGKRKLKKFNEYELHVRKATNAASTLLAELIKARGEDCFLETEWENHKLLCIPKNPRSQK